VLIDAHGTAKLFGTPEQLCTRIKEEMRLHGLEVRIGISADPDTAFLAARATIPL
jgi:hypothetical protein